MVDNNGSVDELIVRLKQLVEDHQVASAWYGSKAKEVCKTDDCLWGQYVGHAHAFEIAAGWLDDLIYKFTVRGGQK